MIELGDLIYVAGRYSHADSWGREQHVRHAEEVSLRLAQDGFTPVCPHTLARFWFGAISEPRAIEIGLRLLEVCRAAVLVEGWETSQGTHGEIRHAHEHGIPVFANAHEFSKYRGSTWTLVPGHGDKPAHVEDFGWIRYPWRTT